MDRKECIMRASQRETSIEDAKSSSIVFEEAKVPIIHLILTIMVGLLFITTSILWPIIQDHQYWIGLGMILCGVLLVFLGVSRLFFYITDIKFDEEALYIRKSTRVGRYRKILWSQIANIRVRIDWQLWNSYLIRIDTIRAKQVIPYWLGPFWPGKYERDIRETFFTELRRKLDKEKERRNGPKSHND
ncbi:MAG: hypothetical protein V2A78_13285 [bacterium]